MRIYQESVAEQRSPEWYAQRLGKVTASRVGDALGRTKTGWSACRDNYRMQLVVERLTGDPVPAFVNSAMEWGVNTEPLARIAYAAATGRMVTETGFFDHPEIAMSGASPDGLVGDDGMVEIKCPTTATHVETLLGAEIDPKHLKQMHWQMACTGRLWCDYVSYDPRVPTELQLHVRRVDRDDKLIAELEAGIRDFLAEVDSTIAALTTLAESHIPY